MKKAKKDNIQFKSYVLPHKANIIKQDGLFTLYEQYTFEYQNLIHSYWHRFLNNEIKNNTFSHLGSTKHISTQLTASYLQCCLAQVCATLNNYLANISHRFNEIVNQSTIKDKDILHQLRTINTNHSWLNKTVEYYPVQSRVLTDDYGHEVIVKYKQPIVIGKSILRLARKIFIHIIGKSTYRVKIKAQHQHGAKVRFPSLKKPRLIIDSRLYTIEESKSSSFDYWLHVSTLNKGQRVSIPLTTHEYFEMAHGDWGKTIELNFLYHDYQKPAHHHQSLSSGNKKDFKTSKINREISIIFNKKEKLDFLQSKIDYTQSVKNVAFDLGLCNFLATSDGEIYGTYWLNKLKEYDKQLVQLHADRQYCLRKKLGKEKINFRSKRYGELMARIRGFIKTETHRILNHYFDTHVNIKTVVIEKLRFSSPDLSKRLNRIIQNFGLKLFKDKLAQLSKVKGFTVEELNSAYTSQECENCGYVDSKNRVSQSLYKCLCCKKELQADVQGARVNLKRFEKSEEQSSVNSLSYKTVYKSLILRKIKMEFVAGIPRLISHGIICRRELYLLLNKNSYFKDEIKAFARTTEAQGVEPMTVWNFESMLLKMYNKMEEKVSG